MNAPADAVIVVADDDEDDFVLIEKALRWVDIEIPVHRSHDGHQLLQTLRQNGFARRVLFILMDLNMPRKNGRETLRELKADSVLRSVPVIILTNSRSDKDAALCYELGANSFMFKPFSFQELVANMRALKSYWLETAELPCKTESSAS